MWSKLALALVAVVLLAPLTAEAAAPRAKLKVEVTDTDGDPVERASVIVQFTEGRSVLKLGAKNTRRWELRTNQEGVANFPTMPQGTVRIMVIADHFQTFGDEFEVNEEEKTIQIELLPPQQPHSVFE